MSEILLVITLMAPLVLAVLQGWGKPSVWIDRLTAWVALPGLLLALTGDDFSQDLPWLLLGSQMGLDFQGRVFLGLTAGLWLAAGLYTRNFMSDDPRRHRFQIFFLLTMAGNLGVTLAHDSISFLAFFTLMSLAAYGLIVHDGQPSSIRAGRIYMAMTIVGELPVLLVWVVHHGIAKSALFLGVGVADIKMPSAPMRSGFMLTMATAELALAGLPGTLGYTAKMGAKYSAQKMELWSPELTWVLAISGVTTSLLVMRFLWLIWQKCLVGKKSPAVAQLGPWFVLAIGVVIGFFWLQLGGIVDPKWSSLAADNLWDSIWPLLVATGLSVVVIGVGYRWSWVCKLTISPGDYYGPLESLVNWLVNQCHQLSRTKPRNLWSSTPGNQLLGHQLRGSNDRLGKRMEDSAEFFENDTVAALALVVLVVLLFFL